MGDTDGAKADLQESLKLVPSFTQSWVKIASVHMEQSNVEKTAEAFEEAIKHNASDPDIYYHRGQGTLVNVCVTPYSCLSSLFHNGRL
jgi:import receptor subunit TOM70